MWASPGGSAVKNLPAIQEPQEMQVQSLGQEDLLEEGMETHFSILPGEPQGQRSLTPVCGVTKIQTRLSD